MPNEIEVGIAGERPGDRMTPEIPAILFETMYEKVSRIDSFNPLFLDRSDLLLHLDRPFVE